MWTDEMEQALIHLWNDEGLTAIQCARRLNEEFPDLPRMITKGSILGRKHRMTQEGVAFDDRKIRVRRRPVSGPTKVVDGVTLVSIPVVVSTDDALSTKGHKQVLFSEATAKQCKWIDGDPRRENLTVCGCPVKEGSSYCEHHHKIVYIPPERSRKIVQRTIK